MKKTLFLLFLFASCLQVLGQTRTISGKVTDEKGAGIIGASVTVKGNSTIGTATDSKGNFSLAVPSFASTLVVSAVRL